MLNKVIAKELELLREKLAKLKKQIDATVTAYQEKDSEYALKKSEYVNQSRHFVDIVNRQDLRLSNLDALIENLELKLKVLLDDLNELKLSFKEDAFEMTKLKAERTETKKANEENVAELKKNIQQTKQDLRDERELELVITQTHEAMMKNVTREFQQKLNDAQKYWSVKYDTAEKKYKAAEEPLLLKIQCLDSAIDAIEEAILSKPNELEALKSRNDMLNKKLQKVAALRFLHESKITKRSLQEALRYVEKRADNINEDLILGVLMAKANLQWIVSALKYQPNSTLRSKAWKDALEHLLWQCNNITELSRFNVPLLNKHLWESSAGDLKSGTLKESDGDFALPEFDSCQAIDMYMMKGTPEDSDFCINELINSDCNVSEICWLSELNGDSHSGYKTSHRLLYFKVAERMFCEKLNPKKFHVIKIVKDKLCQQMLLEARALSEESHFTLTQDLFMEQIALCGLEGHEEFALEIWRDRVRNWQSLEGCFGQQLIKNCSKNQFEKNHFREPVKKTGSNTDDCHPHVTAVAIPTLAFFLRVTLRAAFKLF